MNVLNSTDNVAVKYGLLGHDLGKGLTDPEQHPAHHGHEKLGVKPAKDLANRLGLGKKIKNIMVAAALTHMNLKRFMEMKPSKQIRLVVKYHEMTDLLMEISKVDSENRDGQYFNMTNYFSELTERVNLIKHVIKTIDGKLLRLLGVKEDKNFGQKLEQARISTLKKLIK